MPCGPTSSVDLSTQRAIITDPMNAFHVAVLLPCFILKTAARKNIECDIWR